MFLPTGALSIVRFASAFFFTQDPQRFDSVHRTLTHLLRSIRPMLSLIPAENLPGRMHRHCKYEETVGVRREEVFRTGDSERRIAVVHDTHRSW